MPLLSSMVDLKGFDSRTAVLGQARLFRLTAPSPFVCFADISPTLWGNLPPDCHSLPRRFESPHQYKVKKDNGTFGTVAFFYGNHI